jgi:hypothetical protein
MLTKEQVQLPHCEGEQAATLMQLLEDRFLNVEDNTVQSEKTKFNTLSILQHESGAEFIDRLERQAKTLETLGVLKLKN